MNKEIILMGIVLLFVIGAVYADSENMRQYLKVTVLPVVNITSPVPNEIYHSRQVQINVSANGAFMMKYEVNGKLPVSICVNGCKNNFYSILRPFDDGVNNLTIYATFDEFGTILRNVSNFIVDAKKPVITGFEPKKGFANGTFIVQFQEANPVSLILSYGNNIVGYRNQSLDLNKCSEKKLTKTCKVNVSLNDYNQQGISYWFYVKDIINNQAESKITQANVDFSKPVINSLNYNISKSQVIFYLNISEMNFDKAIFFDNRTSIFSLLDSWKILCPKLTDGNLCVYKRYFSKGHHDVSIKVIDKAGNVAERVVSFVI